jgi:hypothetical protein
VARERPTASDVSQIPAVLDVRPVRGAPDRPDALTQAQAHALRRCAPLTSADFKARGHEVRRRGLSLRQILARGAGDDATSVWQPRAASAGDGAPAGAHDERRP